MAEMAYGRIYSMNSYGARKLLIETWQRTGSIRGTAREWDTSPQVVRKWVRRFQAEGYEGLHDRSRGCTMLCVNEKSVESENLNRRDTQCRKRTWIGDKTT